MILHWSQIRYTLQIDKYIKITNIPLSGTYFTFELDLCIDACIDNKYLFNCIKNLPTINESWAYF